MGKIRVLLACVPAPGSQFLQDWKSSLSAECDVVHDHARFWSGTEQFDIVHIHWPEYLSFETESGLRAPLDPAILERLGERLDSWRARNTRLVIHRHNLRPHLDREGRFDPLYALAYAHADAVIHMGAESLAEYGRRYATQFDISRQRHVIIPHAHFGAYASGVGRAEARRELGIRSGARTVLVFGRFAGDEECALVLQGFRQLPGWNKTLLAPSWHERLLRSASIRLKYRVRDLRRLYHRLHPWYHFGYTFVPDERVQYYLAAADVLLIQRRQPLNSSNLVLGFSFGRVVVGPDHGNVGEILRQTGNPVYESGSAASVGRALERGLALAGQGRGEANRKHALEQWSAEETGRRHVDLYRELLSSQ
jgi:glycosyltransferase involved in cell wall biosynthesis